MATDSHRPPCPSHQWFVTPRAVLPERSGASLRASALPARFRWEKAPSPHLPGLSILQVWLLANPHTGVPLPAPPSPRTTRKEGAQGCLSWGGVGGVSLTPGGAQVPWGALGYPRSPEGARSVESQGDGRGGGGRVQCPTSVRVRREGGAGPRVSLSSLLAPPGGRDAPQHRPAATPRGPPGWWETLDLERVNPKVGV